MSFSIYLIFIVEIVYAMKYIKVPYFQFGTALNLETEMNEKEGKIRKILQINLKEKITFITKDLLKNFNGIEISSSVFNLRDIKDISYTLVKDELYFQQNDNNSKSIILKDFYFYYINRTITYYDTISFAYKFDDIRMSILHNLYKSGMIDHIKFGIERDIYGDGNIYLGGFPKEYTSILNNSFCIISKNANSWGCNLRKVIIGDKVYKNKYSSYFHSYDFSTLVPNDFYSFLMRDIFKDNIKKGKCYSSYYSEIQFLCDCEILNNVPLFNFVIGEYIFELNISTHNFPLGDNCILLLNENEKGKEYWEFRIHFLSKFQTQFDYENNLITFYRNETFIMVKEELNSICILFYICDFIMLSISIFLMHIKYFYLK